MEHCAASTSGETATYRQTESESRYAVVVIIIIITVLLLHCNIIHYIIIRPLSRSFNVTGRLNIIYYLI